MSPRRIIRRPPHNLVPSHCRVGVDIPEQRAVVREDGRVDLRVFGCAGCLRERPERGTVHASHARREVEVDELDQVTELLSCDGVDTDVLVLVREVLVRFGEARSGEAGVEEGLVVATTQETICAVDDAD